MSRDTESPASFQLAPIEHDADTAAGANRSAPIRRAAVWTMMVAAAGLATYGPGETEPMDANPIVTVNYEHPDSAAGQIAYDEQNRPSSALSAESRPHEIIGGNFPDPDILKSGRTFYAYATNGGSGKNIQTASSTSLTEGWKRRRDALPVLGEWASHSASHVWAPHVWQRPDSMFVMYYTAQDKEHDTQCIGTALSAKPLGPFKPIGKKPLVCTWERGGAIDPDTFQDSDGTNYLLYKIDGNSIGESSEIVIQKLSPDGLELRGQPTTILKDTRAIERGIIEAPTLVKLGDDKSGYRYVLFYSAGNYNNDSYSTWYAASNTIGGPYVKARQALLYSEPAKSINGPGGEAIIRVGDKTYMIFHSITHLNPLHRSTSIVPLNVTAAEPHDRSVS